MTLSDILQIFLCTRITFNENLHTYVSTAMYCKSVCVCVCALKFLQNSNRKENLLMAELLSALKRRIKAAICIYIYSLLVFAKLSE